MSLEEIGSRLETYIKRTQRKAFSASLKEPARGEGRSAGYELRPVKRPKLEEKDHLSASPDPRTTSNKAALHQVHVYY